MGTIFIVFVRTDYALLTVATDLYECAPYSRV
jgi:hypothetical protein